jgi:hypothetical protein
VKCSPPPLPETIMPSFESLMGWNGSTAWYEAQAEVQRQEEAREAYARFVPPVEVEEEDEEGEGEGPT